jgi:DNA-binding CsgD family transcriptional regulator
MERSAVRLEARDMRRTREIAEEASRFDGRPILERIVPELPSLLRAECAVAYGVSPTLTGWNLDFAYTAGTSPRLVPALRKHLGETVGRWGAYDPLRPEASQRNVPMKVTNVPSLAPALSEQVFRPAGVARHDQHRVLFCDGPRLLAWVGVFTPGPTTAREQTLFRKLVTPLRRRLKLEQRLNEAAIYSRAFSAAIELAPTATFLLRGDGSVVHTNSIGRALMADRSVDLRARLRAARAGRDPSVSLTSIAEPGMPELYLAVLEQPQNDLEGRLLQAVREWKLTRRQVDVLRELVVGESNKGIGEKLRCGESTVEFHVTSLLRKARVESRAALVARFWSTRPN